MIREQWRRGADFRLDAIGPCPVLKTRCKRPDGGARVGQVTI
jgi:hypothetical protein